MLSPNTSTHIFIMFPVFFPVGGFFHWRSSPPVPTPAETGWSGGTLSVQLQILPCWNRWGQMPIYWGCQGLHWDHRRSVYFSKSKCVLGGAAAKTRTGSKTSRLKSLSQYLCWICTELHPRNVATAASLRVAEKGWTCLSLQLLGSCWPDFQHFYSISQRFSVVKFLFSEHLHIFSNGRKLHSQNYTCWC